MKGLSYAAMVVAVMFLAAGCDTMRALEADLQANAKAHPLGPLGPGLDMYMAGEQIRAARGR